MTIEEAINIYHEHDEQLGYEDRQYGDCVAALDGVVAIADHSSDNGSSLEMYREVDFIKWMIAAREGLERGDFADMCEAVDETRPPCEVGGSH